MRGRFCSGSQALKPSVRRSVTASATRPHGRAEWARERTPDFALRGERKAEAIYEVSNSCSDFSRLCSFPHSRPKESSDPDEVARCPRFLDIPLHLPVLAQLDHRLPELQRPHSSMPSRAQTVESVTLVEGHAFPTGKTFAGQDSLPKLPVPPLEDTMKRYVKALEGLQVRSASPQDDSLRGSGGEAGKERAEACAAGHAGRGPTKSELV